jgi:plastocyanin
MSVITLVSLVSSYSFAQIKGDANQDGVVTSADITCVILGIFAMPCPMPDCNEDGSVTSADITCVILAIFGQSPTPSPTPTPGPTPQTHNVSMNDQLQFVPQVVTINVGDTVKWTNTGEVNLAILHTSTSGDGGPGSGAIWDSDNQFPDGMAPGDMFQFTFNQAGSFPYFCRIHGAVVMSGTVNVE